MADSPSRVSIVRRRRRFSLNRVASRISPLTHITHSSPSQRIDWRTAKAESAERRPCWPSAVPSSTHGDPTWVIPHPVIRPPANPRSQPNPFRFEAVRMYIPVGGAESERDASVFGHGEVHPPVQRHLEPESGTGTTSAMRTPLSGRREAPSYGCRPPAEGRYMREEFLPATAFSEKNCHGFA